MASLVDIDALVNSVSVNFPSELYQTVMKQAGIQLSQQLCGGQDLVFACETQAEMNTYQAAWLVVAEDVLLRWHCWRSDRRPATQPRAIYDINAAVHHCDALSLDARIVRSVCADFPVRP